MDTQMQWEFSRKFWNQSLDIWESKVIFLLHLLMTSNYRQIENKSASKILMLQWTYVPCLGLQYIHERKSVLIPTQKIEFLGFLIDSRNMSISISEEKADHLILKIRKFLNISAPTIWQLSIIGSIISLFPAISLGRLHYRA